MRTWIKRILWVLGLLLLLAGGWIGFFIYQVSVGLPIYEHTPPDLPEEMEEFSVLVFSKTNGFRHDAAIGAGKAYLDSLGTARGWTVFTTDNGAVFAPELLSRFDLVVWNNVTGKVLTDTQREAFRAYMEAGGGFVGIHGAGDGSHKWAWYEDELLGARFSHHPMNPQLQVASMHRECDSTFGACASLPESFERKEEWYIFFNNPRDRGKTVLYTVDERTIVPDGQFLFFGKDKKFGMGEDHPIVWYGCIGQGRAFYSALGHSGTEFTQEPHLQLLEAGIRWAGGMEGGCP